MKGVVVVSVACSLLVSIAATWFTFQWLITRNDPLARVVTVDIEELVAAKKAQLTQRLLATKEPLDEKAVETDLDGFIADINTRLAEIPDNYIVLTRQAVLRGQHVDITSQLTP